LNVKEELNQINEIEKSTSFLVNEISKILANFKPKLESYFNELHLLIEEKKKTILKKIDDLDEPNLSNLKIILKMIQKCKEGIELKLKTLEDFEKKYPLSLNKNLTKVYEDIQKLPKFRNNILSHKNQISYYSNKMYQAPELTLNGINEFLFTLNSKFNLEKTQIPNYEKDKMILWADNIDSFLKSNGNVIEFKENPSWKNSNPIYPFMS